jgi:hypothetical protein
MQRGRLVFCSMVRVNGVFWGLSIGRKEGKRKEKTSVNPSTWSSG